MLSGRGVEGHFPADAWMSMESSLELSTLNSDKPHFCLTVHHYISNKAYLPWVETPGFKYQITMYKS